MEDFEDWVAARSGALARSAYLLTGDVQLAEDLVQEALARVAQHWRRIGRHHGPDAYARRVMHNLAIDGWRRRRVRPTEVLTDDHGELRGRNDQDADVDQRVVLRTALLRITARQRAVLSLRFLEDLTEVQSAAVLDCSVSTVNSQTRDALARLRALAPDLLADLGPGPAHSSLETEVQR